MKTSFRTGRTKSGLKLEFRKLPEWRAEEIIEEMDEGKRKNLILELKRRLASNENVFYAEIPVEGGPGETVGVGSWKVRSWPRLEGRKESAGLVEVSFIHVRPSHRGKGIGGAILENALKEASEHFTSVGETLRKAYALVPSGNQKGIEAYRSWGFQFEATLGKHFSNDFDMVVMSRYL